MSDTYAQQHAHYGSDTAYLGCLKAERRANLRRSDRTEVAERLAEMEADNSEPQAFYFFATELDDESRFIWELDEYPPTAGCSWDNVDFCHVCGRVTNHVAEHDDPVVGAHLEHVVAVAADL